MNTEPIDGLDFEQALNALQQLVEHMETGKLTLEASLAEYERGVQLSQRCQALLDGAEQRVRILIENKQLTEFDDKPGKRGDT
ncbi:MAG: exodeoxyribonuclease VII small subunit [Thiotrichales bacterium]